MLRALRGSRGVARPHERDTVIALPLGVTSRTAGAGRWYRR